MSTPKIEQNQAKPSQNEQSETLFRQGHFSELSLETVGCDFRWPDREGSLMIVIGVVVGVRAAPSFCGKCVV